MAGLGICPRSRAGCQRDIDRCAYFRVRREPSRRLHCFRDPPGARVVSERDDFLDSPQKKPTLVLEPRQPGLQPVWLGAADAQDFHARVNATGVLLGGLEIEGNIRQQIDFAEDQQLRLEEDRGIFEGLVIAFGHAQDHDLRGLAQVVAGRAHEVPDIFNEQDVEAGQAPVGQVPLNHARIEVAGAAGGDLFHGEPEALETGRVIFRLDVAGEHGHSRLARQGRQGAFQKSGLARARRTNQVDAQDTVLAKTLAQARGEPFVFTQDFLFQEHSVHSGPPPRRTVRVRLRRCKWCRDCGSWDSGSHGWSPQKLRRSSNSDGGADTTQSPVAGPRVRCRESGPQSRSATIRHRPPPTRRSARRLSGRGSRDSAAFPSASLPGSSWRCPSRARRPQQMRGSWSPASMSTTRLVPSSVRRVTSPGWAAQTVPIMRASLPSGWDFMTESTLPAASGGTIATSLPSLATYSGSRPNISQAPRTSSRTGISRSTSSTPTFELAAISLRELDKPPRVGSRIQRSPAQTFSISATSPCRAALSLAIADSNSNPSRWARMAMPWSPIVPLSRTRSPGRARLAESCTFCGTTPIPVVLMKS